MNININSVINSVEKIYRLESSDTNLIPSYEIPNTFDISKNVIELRIYDEFETLLIVDNNFKNYTISNSTNTSVSEINVDISEILQSANYNEGIFNVTLHFYEYIISDYYLSEVSSSRKELRIKNTSNKADINYIQQLLSLHYFLILKIDNEEFVVINALENNGDIILKLYEPLSDFPLKTKLSLVDEVSISYKLNITLDPELIPLENPSLKGPNFNIDIETNNSYLYETLTLDDRLKNITNDKSYTISIDYSDFSSFIHFGSIISRLEGFYSKLEVLEGIISRISLLENSYNVNKQLEINLLTNQYSDIVSSLDHYEYFLMFIDSPYSWPKLNGDVYSTQSSTAQSWLENIKNTAKEFDENNKDSLINLVPRYIINDDRYSKYIEFIKMIGHYYDNIWIFIESISDIDTTNDINKGLSRDLTYDILKSFNININNIGGNNIQEYYLESKDIKDEIYKRIYHNINLLFKSKGTKTNIENIISLFGLSSDILDVKVSGGSKDNYFLGYNTNDINIDETDIQSTILNSLDSIKDYNEETKILPNTNTIDVAFSPQNIINERIKEFIDINQTNPDEYVSFNVNKLIGDPRDQYKDNYPQSLYEMRIMKDYIFPSKIDYTSFNKMVSYLDNTMWVLMKEFSSKSEILLTGITIKPTTIYRNKIRKFKPEGDLNNIFDVYLKTANIDKSEDSNFELYEDKRKYYNGELNFNIESFGSYFESINKNPYITKYYNFDYRDFEKSNYNPLRNNISSYVTTNKFKIEPIFDINNNVISYVSSSFEGTDLFASSDLSSRYDGLRMYSLKPNIFTDGDVSYGKNSIIDNYVNKIGLFTKIDDSLFIEGKNPVSLKYLVDKDGNFTELNQNNKHWVEIQNTFKSNKNSNVSLFENKKYSNQKTSDGEKIVWESGYNYNPILYGSKNENSYKFYKLENSFNYYSSLVNGNANRNIMNYPINNYPLIGSYVRNFMDQVVEGESYVQTGSTSSYNYYTVPELGNYRIKANIDIYTTSTSSFNSVWSLELYKNNILYASSSTDIISPTGTGSCYYYQIITNDTSSLNINNINVRYTTCGGTTLNAPIYNDHILSGGYVVLSGFSARSGSVLIYNGNAEINQLNFIGNYYYDVDRNVTGSLSLSIDSISAQLNDTFSVRLKQVSTDNFNYQVSMSEGSYIVNNLSQAVGNYVDSGYIFDTGSLGTSYDEIILSKSLSLLHNNGYIFNPNPVNSPSSSLYSLYKDVDYTFNISKYDLFILYLSDGSIVISTIIDTYNDNNNNLRLKLDKPISNNIKNSIINKTFDRFIILYKMKDETSLYLDYKKNPGNTSYGLLIPENINPDLLSNIDIITKEIKTKLIQDINGYV